MKEISNKLFEAVEAVSSEKYPVSIQSITNNGDHLVVELNGGSNGQNDWITYIKQVGSIIKKLQPTKSWIINWDNDCTDDVWYLNLGIDLVGDKEVKQLPNVQV